MTAAPNTGPQRHGRRSKHAVYTSETVGLIIISLMILAVILIRNWGHIPWGAR
jgi:hypothetical protein